VEQYGEAMSSGRFARSLCLSLIMATMRNIAISLLRLACWTNIKQATEKMRRRLDQVLTLLGV